MSFGGTILAMAHTVPHPSLWFEAAPVANEPAPAAEQPQPADQAAVAANNRNLK